MAIGVVTGLNLHMCCADGQTNCVWADSGHGMNACIRCFQTLHDPCRQETFKVAATDDRIMVRPGASDHRTLVPRAHLI